MVLFWFRRDLRLHDNSALSHALASGQPVLPLFIFDSDILTKLSDPHDARITFIHQTLTSLHQQLEQRGSTLLVRHGRPLEVMAQLLQEYPLQEVYTNRDYEPYARLRDSEVTKQLLGKGIAFRGYKDQVIFEQDEILTKGGTPYKVYTPYKNAWKSAFTESMATPYPSEEQLHGLQPHPATTLPTLADIGFAAAEIPTPSPSLSETVLRQYDKTRNLPALDATSRLSPHLRFGTVSVRQAVQLALQHNDTWLQELIWREFFMQLLFHFPESAEESFAQKFRHIDWRSNEKEFQLWCDGKTGFPLVDAGMRELNATGFMHNRVRMVVASFLVKDLLIDWRWGEAYFAGKLLDYEQASNVGNWQWAAGTGADAQPYFRIFNPDSQVKKFDKDHRYIKRWVPEFGTSAYPAPMVDHAEARDRALAAYKKSIAYTL
ncbi:DNA photolyase family protein [Pontibacter sp. E15-1]|uniref:cryptochrome/photolyase family protein n=1 Tax=Pontibacter sp. E15-1 TaxID=2919918 RepID=UPI001F501F5C|nr:deoxyribodipyrimidine photo-lyase [Pontibacter sp. E15-1]MCJ8164993.1 DNA photolyase family protein [Pontibacter sp. E15-1]